MTVMIALLRGVNVGGNRLIKMEALRGLCESLGLRDVQTYVQSGNLVFRSKESDPSRVSKKIADGIERTFGFRPEVMTRTTAEFKSAITRNPFPKRSGMEPNKFLVTFLAADPGPEARVRALQIKTDPEELGIDGRELYVYYPNGMGKSKLPALIDRALKTPGTGRNWNTVTKLLEMAELLETQ
jgi:uncharacterized protein (DUF1697 family)